MREYPAPFSKSNFAPFLRELKLGIIILVLLDSTRPCVINEAKSFHHTSSYLHTMLATLDPVQFQQLSSIGPRSVGRWETTLEREVR